MDFVGIFNISLDLSTIYFAYFNGCQASFVYSCHFILECYNLFSGVKLSKISFCFICRRLLLFHSVVLFCSQLLYSVMHK